MMTTAFMQLVVLGVFSLFVSVHAEIKAYKYCSHGGWNQEFNLDREHLVTNYLAGFQKAGGCCNKESKKLSEADLSLCRSSMYVDVKRASNVWIHEPNVDKSFLKTQPA